MASSIGAKAVEAFDNSIAREFLAYIRGPTHSNRYRMTYDRKALITAFCLNPQRPFPSLEERNAYLLSREFCVVNYGTSCGQVVQFLEMCHVDR